MRCIAAGLLCAAVLCAGIASASEADTLHAKGMELLKEAMVGDNARVVPAAKAFIKATALYEEAESFDKAQESRACLYWCKKKMTVNDAEAFVKGMPDKYKDISEAKVDAEEAQEYFDRAKAFADKNPEEHLLTAVRYFEVADRFKGSDVSLKAQDLSLAAMQKIKTAPNYKPAKPEAIAAIASAEVEKAWEPYSEAVATAKKKYVVDLEKAIKYESGKGNLEEAMGIKKEIERMADPKVIEPGSEFKSKKAQHAAKTYQRSLGKAQKTYARKLKLAVMAETKKGNLEVATAVSTVVKAIGREAADIRKILVTSRWQKNEDGQQHKGKFFRNDGKWALGGEYTGGHGGGTWKIEDRHLILKYRGGYVEKVPVADIIAGAWKSKFFGREFVRVK